MIKFETRIREYASKLGETFKDYEKKLNTIKDLEELKLYKRKIEKINFIYEMGIINYYCLRSIPSINIFAENHDKIDDLAFEKIAKRKYGMEKEDIYYNQIKKCDDVDKIRNIIWKNYFGLGYDLISRDEALAKIDKIKSDRNLSDEEKEIEIFEVVCKSGYYDSVSKCCKNPINMDCKNIDKVMKKICK